jgi:hypothetical protein
LLLDILADDRFRFRFSAYISEGTNQGVGIAQRKVAAE